MGICKLVIKAYDDNSYGSEKGEFVTTINPTNLKISNKIDYVDSQMMGNPTWALQYNKTQPRILSFSLLFDNTGIFPNSNIDVKQQVKNLEWLIFSNQKDIDEPYFVRIIWGDIDFKGKLLRLETSFSMFKNDGSPIRAQADIEIIEHHAEEIRGESQKEIKEEEKNENETEEKNENNKNTNEQAENKSNDENAEENNDSNTEAKEEVEEAKNKEEEKTEENKEEENANDKEEEKTEENKEEENANDKEEEKTEENKEEENANDQEEENKEEKTEENKEEENANDQEEENKEENKDKDTEENKSEEKNVEGKTHSSIIKAGDSLPSITKKNLTGLSKIGSILSKVAKLNLLDSLRKLIVGAALLIPLTIAALLALLLKKLISLIKRGVTFIKSKTKKGISNIKNASKNGLNKIKKGANKITNNTKKGYQKVKNKVKRK